MSKIMFTATEHEVIKRNLEKLMDIRKDLSSADWEKTTHKTIKQTSRKFGETYPENEMHLNRQSLRLLQELITAGVQTLVSKVVPEYEERVKTDEGKYRPYLERAQALIAAYESARAKVEAKL